MARLWHRRGGGCRLGLGGSRVSLESSRLRPLCFVLRPFLCIFLWGHAFGKGERGERKWGLQREGGKDTDREGETPTNKSSHGAVHFQDTFKLLVVPFL